MFQAVLFDLDGTLLDIDLDGFLRDYFTALGPVLAEVAGNGADVRSMLGVLMASTQAMCDDSGERTNREVFNAHFFDSTGVDLDTPIASAHIERFYADTFPLLRSTHTQRSGAHDAVAAARRSGARVALATNPIFPEAAVHERMRWADLETEWFDTITTYEGSQACKPSGEYFLQVASTLGVDPVDCLFVGDDAELDMPAREVGMTTFYVGSSDATADHHGDLHDVAALLARG